MKSYVGALVAGALALCACPMAARAQAAPPPGASSTALDPARLALARKSVDYIWPAGTYERMMRGTMDKMMDSIIGSMFDLPLGDIDPETKAGKGSLAELAKIEDPHFRERMDLSTRAMLREMIPLLNDLEPGIREGLAEAYARKYTPRQLDEMNAFFATPTGTAYARDAYMMFMDPAVMAKVQGFMPAMMKSMPAMIEKMQAATADLPPPRKFNDLSDAEKARVAELRGKSVADLQAWADVRDAAAKPSN